MINRKMQALGARRSVIRELFEYGNKRRREIGEDKVFDFSLGNPSVPAPETVNQALKNLIEEYGITSLHAYTSAQGDYGVRAAIADYINREHGTSFTADSLYMTVGAAGGLTSVITALTTEGEEVIVLTPYFPEYKVFIERCGASVREVPTRARSFTLDIDAIERAVSDKTAAIIVNSPNNPTGVVFSEEDISSLAEMLSRKERELSKSIYIISDEPYRELVYDGRGVPYIPCFYKNTVVCYSYSKSLSLPGERIGYIALSPDADNFTEAYQAIAGAARALGFVCAPSMLQKMLPYCLGLTSDTSVYDKNRRLLVSALTDIGYECVYPDGAFYLFMRAPMGDASEFSERAKKFELLLVPSDDFGIAGYVRIAYCVKTEQIEASIPAFRALYESYEK